MTSRRPKFRTARPLKLLVPAVVAIAFAAACGGGLDARLQAAIDDTETVSPLALVVGASPDETIDFAVAEDRITECMARAGFTYEPQLPPTTGIQDLAGSDLDLADIQTNGYGIASDLELGLTQATAGPVADPNDEIRAGLSADELVRYEQALTGLGPDEVVIRSDGAPTDPNTGEVLTPAQYEAAASDGCAFQAYAPQINQGAARLLTSDVYAEVQAILAADSRMLELQADWRRCMGDAGFAFRHQGDIFDELAGAGDDIFHDASNQGHSHGEADVHDHSHDGTEDHSHPDPADIDARIDALRDREIAIAEVDWACSQDLFAEVPEISRRVESDYIVANQDRLIDLLDQSVEA